MAKEKLTILKIGGNICEDEQNLELVLSQFSAIKGKKVLVHGGGKSASELSKQLGVPVKMVDGRRITDMESLKVAVMVYAGWMNKTMVARLFAKGCNALGLCGADLGIIQSEKRAVNTIDYGFVGDVKAVNINRLIPLLDARTVPVFSAITVDSQGQLLNTNADTMAAEVAKALRYDFDVTLLYCFDKPGVMKEYKEGLKVIENLRESEFIKGIEEGFIVDGMIPKLQNGFDVVNQDVTRVFVAGVSSLNAIFTGRKGGTRLWKN